MSISSVVPARSQAGRSDRLSPARAAFATLGVLTALIAPAQAAKAQNPTPRTSAWEFRVTSGAFVPTGSQRTPLQNAQVTAAQVSWAIRPSLAITGTFGWARSRDMSATESPRLDVFTSDLGVEARGGVWFAQRAVTFTPFAGLGAGVRSYNYRSRDVNATHNAAGYGTVGGEVGIGRVGVRLEVRDYATGFKPLVGRGPSDVRNDVVMMVALRFNRPRRAPIQ
jgi:hypothetical protein